MQEIARIEFDQHLLTFMQCRSRPCVPARQVGAAIGMSHKGKRLPTMITHEWADEFVEGVDYDRLRGEELAMVRGVLERGTQDVPLPGRGSLMVLYESGLHLVLVKSKTDAGRRLRRLLAEEVLPQIARDGRFDPERTVDEGCIVERNGHASSSLAERREARLAWQALIREREVDLRDRRFRVSTLHRTISSLNVSGHLGATAITALEVSASEIALQRPLDQFKPTLAQGHWRSPSALASRWGVSVQRVGRTITKLGLRQEREGFAISILNVARKTNRQVTTWLYSPEAIALIAAELVAQGHIDSDEP